MMLAVDTTFAATLTAVSRLAAAISNSSKPIFASRSTGYRSTKEPEPLVRPVTRRSSFPTATISRSPPAQFPIATVPRSVSTSPRAITSGASTSMLGAAASTGQRLLEGSSTGVP